MIAKGKQQLISKFLARTHDTEMWANYLPKVNRHLILAAGLGLVTLLGSALLPNANPNFPRPILLLAGSLLILPWLVTTLFVRWRWGYSASVRQQILDAIPWQGDEQVLDIGCGAGLLLNGAAQRLTTGRALGIDLWIDHGGGGDHDLLQTNARAEGVADKIEFQEMDARAMQFPDQSFDVVVSSSAIHHICGSMEDFKKVLTEIVRVTKPGGTIAIMDTTHMIEALDTNLPAAGFTCQVYDAPPFLHYEHKMLVGKKAA